MVPLAFLDGLLDALRLLAAGLGLVLAVGTGLSLTRIPAWPARVWDFPRVQMAVLALACGVVVPALAWAGDGRPGAWTWAFAGLMAAVVAWQAWCIRAYTPLAGVEVKGGDGRPGDPHVVRVVISNLLESNRQFDRWRQVVAREDPDVVVAAEADEAWVREIGRAFDESHPHRVARPQTNCYGMALWSRLPLEEERLEFVVQDDIPSIHATLRMRNGAAVCLHALHPRPPAPQEGDSSAPRDAELVVMGKRIRAERERGEAEPTLVVGDLNDVAWSRTTELFKRLSGLLDPRRGRGFYNTFSANSRVMRFPLDHVFVSPEFRLIDLRVLDHVGSDHFPVCVTLSLEPARAQDQPEMEPDRADLKEAEETIETQVQREEQGVEKGHLAQTHGAPGRRGPT